MSKKSRKKYEKVWKRLKRFLRLYIILNTFASSVTGCASVSAFASLIGFVMDIRT